MKTRRELVILAVLLALGSATLTYAADRPLKTIRGEVLKMEGNSYLLKDASGKEIRLLVNKDTKMEDAFKVGDKIEAQVSDQGMATVIKKVADAGSGAQKQSGPNSGRGSPGSGR